MEADHSKGPATFSGSDSHLPFLLWMGEIQQSVCPAVIGWPGAVKAKAAGLQGGAFFARNRASTPGNQLLRCPFPAGPAEHPFDAASGDQRPSARADHGADHIIIQATVADQSPVDLHFDASQTFG